jgi:Ca2+-binding RTX toxin-like protein
MGNINISGGNVNFEGANLYEFGSSGNDRLEGKPTNGTDILIGLGGRDTLVGAEGVDRFLLGKTKSADGTEVNLPGETGKEVYYNKAGNDDYALIQNFDYTQDFIELAGSKSDYRLGASPSGLPEGTGIFQGDELITIVEGKNSLTLDAPYFQASIA